MKQRVQREEIFSLQRGIGRAFRHRQLFGKQPNPHHKDGDHADRRQNHPPDVFLHEYLAILPEGIGVFVVVAGQPEILHGLLVLPLRVQHLADGVIRVPVVGVHDQQLLPFVVGAGKVVVIVLQYGGAKKLNISRGLKPVEASLVAVQDIHGVPNGLQCRRRLKSPQLIAVGAEHRDEIPLGRILKDPSAPFIQQVQETILIHIDIDKPGEGIGEHIPVPFLVAEKGVGVLGQNVVSLIIQHPHHPVLVGGAGGPGYGIDKAVGIHIKIGKGHRRVQFQGVYLFIGHEFP